MPIFRLNTYALIGEECVQSVYTVIQDRYRLMDSAHLYRNEVEAVAVRRVIVKCLIKREKL